MADQPQRIEISATELRARFASSDYPAKVIAGNLEPHVIYDRPIAGGGSSRIIAYTERGETTKRLVVHQRTHADGSATQPDPKLMFWDGVFYWTK